MRAFLLALVWPTATVLAGQCYFPNGKVVNSDTACNPNALVSACCFDNQACLSNGLCVSDPHDPVKARLHRGTCTDAQWKSGNCPRHCLDIDNNGVPVYSCNSTTTDSYCCYDGCDCKANSGFEIFTFAQSPADVYTLTIIGEDYTQTHTSTASSTATSAAPSITGTSASSAVTSSAAASSPNSSPKASSPASPSTSHTGAPATSSPGSGASSPKTSNGSNGVALGVGLGIGLPAAALLGIGIFFFLRRRKNRNPYAATAAAGSSQFSGDADEYALSPQSPSERYAYMAEKGQAAPTTATAAAPLIHEMSGDRNEKISELPATGNGAQSMAGGKARPGPVELYSP